MASSGGDPVDPRQPVNSAAAVDSAIASLLAAAAVGVDSKPAAPPQQAPGMEAELVFRGEPTTHTRVPYTEMTLALIKPDALKAGHEREIRCAIHSNGFIVIHEAIIQLTKVRAAIFYGEHKEKPWFERLVKYISSAPMLAFVLGKERAARSWNVVVGPTDPDLARKESPLSLRARFGKDILRNAVHGSFSAARAREEIKFIFPNVVVDPVADTEEARLYFDKHLKRTLVKGLTALAKAKPCIQPNTVIRWFADWLLRNNPNRPYVDGERYMEVEWHPSVHSCSFPSG